MQCPKCQAENLLSAKFCSQCGTKLEKTPVAKKYPRALLAGSLLVFLLVLAGGIFIYYLSNPPAPPVHPVAPVGDDNIREIVVTFADNEQAPAQAAISTGRVIIENENNETVSDILAAITGDNIIALPVKACIGGSQWACFAEKTLYTISEGSWQEEAPLALWFLDNDPNKAPNAADRQPIFPLADWQPEAQLTWHALNQTTAPVMVALSFIEKTGFFDKCAIPRHINAPGVFVQDGAIVGWTFGPQLSGAYMWAGPTGPDLYANITVKYFYDHTFVGGREAQLAKARSLPADTPAATRLDAYAQAFFLAPQLSAALTPDNLKAEPVCDQMARLARQLIDADDTYTVSRALDEAVLRKAGCPELLSLAVTALSNPPGGNRSALNLLEALREDMLNEHPGYKYPLDTLHLSLYKQLINDAIKDGNVAAGRQGLQRAGQYFPDDPELHLMAVSLLVQENQWAEAQEKLAQRAYPAALSHKADMLQDRINELKSLDGKTVIRFQPGASHIPVVGRLNDAYTQKFIVDTGATSTTIPRTMVNKLGLAIDDNTPLVRVVTAGKVVTCYRLTLDTLEIQGQTVHNLAVLVLDIEKAPDVGLLGLNFLNKFDVAIDNDKGIMTLAPIF